MWNGTAFLVAVWAFYFYFLYVSFRAVSTIVYLNSSFVIDLDIATTFFMKLLIFSFLVDALNFFYLI